MLIAAIGYALIASGIGWAIIFALGDDLIGRQDRVALCLIWFTVTLALFLIPSGPIFLLFMAVLMVSTSRMKTMDPLALGVFFLFVAPTTGISIEGLPGINYLLDFTVALFASALLILPQLLKAPKADKKRPLAVVDAAVIVFFLLLCVLAFRGQNFTSGLRGCTEWAFKVPVPYFAFSRAIATPERLERVLRTFLVAVFAAGSVAFFIAVTHWQFYDLAETRLFDRRPGAIMWRAGLMRSGGPLAGSPLSFGVVLVTGLAVTFSLFLAVRTKWKRAAALGVPFFAVLGTVSRGALVGAILVVMMWPLTRHRPARALVRTGAMGTAVVLPFVLFTGLGRDILNVLPWINDDESVSGTLNYRQDLLRIGMKVALKNPLFGRRDFKADPDMQELVQGQGIIDVVNTYLQYALAYGFIVAGLYAFIIAFTAWSLFRTVRRLPAEDASGLRAIGGGLFAATVAFAVMVASTTSVTGILPTYTWIFFGLTTAYVRVAHAYGTVADAAPHQAADDPGPPAAAPAPAAAAAAASAADGPGDAARPEPASPLLSPRSQAAASLPPGPRW